MPDDNPSRARQQTNQERRNSKAAEAAERIELALSSLAEDLDSGQSATLAAFLQAMGRFHRYSLRNAMLIQAQRPDATRVAGFGTWKKLRRFVKKGEKGIVIVSPIVAANDDDADCDEVRGFRAAHVFDILQTDGEPLPETECVTGDPGEATNLLKSFAGRRGIDVQHSPLLGTADGASNGGRIELREGLEPAKEFAVLAHELAHELLHRGPERPDLTVRETEAEAVAFSVSHAIGLDTGSSATDYIQLYRGDKETLLGSLERVHDVASELLQFLTDAPEASAAAA